MKFEDDLSAIERDLANSLGRHPNVSGREFQRACIRIWEAFFSANELMAYNPEGDELDLVAERVVNRLVTQLETKGLELQIKKRLQAAFGSEDGK